MLWTNLSSKKVIKYQMFSAMLLSSLILKPNVERIYPFRQVVKYLMFRAISSSLILTPNVTDEFILQPGYKTPYVHWFRQCYHPA
jgi:hypothetical protein